MQTAVDRFLGNPTARLALAAVASIVVLADLIVVVGLATGEDDPVPRVTVPAASVAPSPLPSVEPFPVPPSVAPSAPSAQLMAPPSGVPVWPTPIPTPPTGRVARPPAPAPAATSRRPRPTSARPTSARPTSARPTSARRSQSPFEQRCRDGEISPWLCQGLPN